MVPSASVVMPVAVHQAAGPPCAWRASRATVPLRHPGRSRPAPPPAPAEDGRTRPARRRIPDRARCRAWLPGCLYPAVSDIGFGLIELRRTGRVASDRHQCASAVVSVLRSSNRSRILWWPSMRSRNITAFRQFQASFQRTGVNWSVSEDDLYATLAQHRVAVRARLKQ